MAELKNTTINDSGFLRLPSGSTGQRPSSPAVGDTRINTDTQCLEYYNGTSWIITERNGRTSANPGKSAQEITRLRDLTTPTQVWIDPINSGNPFQIYAANNLQSLGTVQSGGPSWVYDITGINILSRSVMNQTDTMLISYENYLDLYKGCMLPGEPTGSTPYTYWAIFQSPDGGVSTGSLVGVTRTRFIDCGWDEWRLHHTGDYAPGPTDLTAEWYVWGTSLLPSGSPYTVTNDRVNHVRSIPYRNDTSINGGTYGASRGLHYKRRGDGEHYPWRDSSDVMNSEGYFQPASSNSFYGLGTSIVQYIFMAEN